MFICKYSPTSCFRKENYWGCKLWLWFHYIAKKAIYRMFLRLNSPIVLTLFRKNPEKQKWQWHEALPTDLFLLHIIQYIYIYNKYLNINIYICCYCMMYQIYTYSMYVYICKISYLYYTRIYNVCIIYIYAYIMYITFGKYMSRFVKIEGIPQWSQNGGRAQPRGQVGHWTKRQPRIHGRVPYATCPIDPWWLICMCVYNVTMCIHI